MAEEAPWKETYGRKCNERLYASHPHDIVIGIRAAGPRGETDSMAAIVCQTLDEFIAKSTGYEMLAAA